MYTSWDACPLCRLPISPSASSQCGLWGGYCCCSSTFAAPLIFQIHMGRLRPLVLEGRSGYVTGMSNKWLTSAWEHQEPRCSVLFLLLPQQSLKSHVEMWCCGWSSGNPQVVTLQILLSHTGFEFGGLFVIAAQPNLSWLILSVMNQMTSWSWVCLICLWELVSPNFHCWDYSDSQPLYHQRKKE